MNKKIFLISIGIFLINLVFKGYVLLQVPNSISMEELEFFKAIQWYSLPVVSRYIPLLFSSLVPVLAFLLFSKLTGKLWLGVTVALSFTVSPWLFILSRFFNTTPFIVFLFFVFTLILYKMQRIYAVALVLLFGLLYIKNVSLAIPPYDTIQDFFMLLDFRTFFFQGDYKSVYLHIPLTGFFLYIDVIAFIVGLCSIFTPANRKNMLFVLTTFCVGIFYFFVTIPTLIPTYKGIPIFIVATILIGIGYYYIFALLYKKSILLAVCIGIILVGNILFYQELFYNHFDKRNSSEWSYAEKLIVSKLVTNKQFTTVHISPESSKVTSYLAEDKNKYRYNTLTDWSYKSICQTPHVLCILREGEKQRWNVVNEEVKEVIPHFNGLPAYVLLYK